MKKLITFCVLWIYILGFSFGSGEDQVPCIRIGDVYQVKTDEFIPVFANSRTDFEYEIGFHGNNCYGLVSTLLPGFYVQIKNHPSDEIYEIVATLNHSYTISGYIHRKFIVDGMNICPDVKFENLDENVQIPSVREILDRAKTIYESNMQYCFGANCPREIKVSSLYRFHQNNVVSGLLRGYTCQGFDSSGLLHYLSNGYLPHSSKELLKFGKILFVISHKRNLTQSAIEEVIREIKDTDLIVFFPNDETKSDEFYGHVMMAYRFGIIESRGKSAGIVRSPRHEIESRLNQVFRRAKSFGSDLYVLRWHPELLR